MARFALDYELRRRPYQYLSNVGFPDVICLCSLFLTSLCILGVGHVVSAVEPTAESIEFFERRVRPILVEHCYECHSKEAGKRSGGLWLDRKVGWETGGDLGTAIIPGDVEASLLIKAIRYRDRNLEMPPNGKLPERKIAILEEWIRRGATDPRNEDRPVKKNPIDVVAARDHWAFQQAQAQPLATSPVSFPSNRIDAFIQAQLGSRELRPSESADLPTLIRRLSFDLIGLPPTPEEVTRFSKESSPDSVARLVDRLLAAPQAGERWARLWLDLARYTDATASWLKSTAQAHLYRDWVVTAFNEDLPYDQFAIKQLAVDAMDGFKLTDLPALGFLGLSPTYWKELLLPPEIIKVIVADEWDERVDAVSRTFLGLTVSCARCHDHKFDPISTEDYYAVAGVFASTKFADRPLIPESEYAPVREAKSKVEVLEAKLEELRKQKPVETTEVRKLEDEVNAIKTSTPHYNTVLANVVADASLYVVQAGAKPQDGTVLEYREGSQDLNLFIRGNPNQLGPTVARRFLPILSDAEPIHFTNGSGRLELAQAIFRERSMSLAARVIVNRIWLAHFGRGLVESPSNFGLEGDRPSHPRLLEDLTARFMQHNWSIKWLHREITNSDTFQQSSKHDAKQETIDPENRYLWRMTRRRLDVEPWRDAMLAVAGTLDTKLGGVAVALDDVGNRRRTLYGTVHRREMPSLLRLYDFPDPSSHSPQRVNTTTALQGLFVLNSPTIAAHSEALADRILAERQNDVHAQIERVYQLLFQRLPTEEERQLGMAFVSADVTAWAQYVQALLGSNEFAFID